jgi:hypothetical protein
LEGGINGLLAAKDCTFAIHFYSNEKKSGRFLSQEIE